jgi:iron complex transport system substrate-binding protein
VANDVNIVAMMFALGVEDRMVGISGISDQKNMSVLRAAFPEATKRVPLISSDYFSKEVLLAANPDLVFAGYGYGFSKEGGITPESLAELGIATYQLSEACLQPDGKARGAGMAPLDSVYHDLLNLGKIFRIEGKAEQLVAGYKARVEAVQRAIPAGKAPVPVFLYDSGTDSPLTSGSEAIPSDVIKRAGGRNIFDDTKDSWIKVSWEEIVKRNPAFIVIVDYGQTTAEQKLQFLRTNPVIAQVPAVANNRFLVLSYAHLTPSPFNIEAIEQLGQALTSVS